MDWFRLHTEARNDAKLRALTADQFRVWFNLLCFAAEQKTRGTIRDVYLPLLAVEVASGDQDLLQDTLMLLCELRMIAIDNDNDSITFVNFSKRQYDKPSDTPESVNERVSRHRQRTRNAPATSDGSLVSQGNADETPGNPDVTRCNALDTDTEADADTEKEGGDARAQEGEPDVPAPAEPPPPVEAEKPKKRPDPDEAAKSLLCAFRRKRFPGKPEFQETDWRDAKPALKAAVQSGATPELMEQATGAALTRYRDRGMVTVRAIVRNWDALLEPDGAPPGPGPAASERRTERESAASSRVVTAPRDFVERSEKARAVV